MRGIVAYHQDIYAKRQMSNGVIPHVCATEGQVYVWQMTSRFCAAGGAKGWGGDRRGGAEGGMGEEYWLPR